MPIPRPPQLDESQLIIYNYDPYFVRAYDLLIEQVSEVFHKNKYWDLQAQDYFSLHVILELLVDKLRKQVVAEEYLFEDMYETFPVPVCQDLVEIMSNFLHMNIYPVGLREIVATIDKEMHPVDIIFDPDDDATYYLFDF